MANLNFRSDSPRDWKNMLYRQLAEVSVYVTNPNHKFTDILQMLCIKAMSSLQVDALLFTEIDVQGKVIAHSSFGIEIADQSGQRPTFSLSERTPFTDAIRENKIIWVDSLPSWPKPYQKMAQFPIPCQTKSLVSCPIDVGGLPIGSLTAFSHTKIQFEESIAQYLDAITIIFAHALRHHNPGRTNMNRNESNSNLQTFFDPAEYEKPLTERQNLILKMIAEGRTNAAIADVLGYSESLIRQETIKIYAKLGCSGRNEAAQIFNTMGIADESISA